MAELVSDTFLALLSPSSSGNLFPSFLSRPGARFYSEAAYAQSKLAQILFAREMRRRLGSEPKIQVCSKRGVAGGGVVQGVCAGCSASEATAPCSGAAEKEGLGMLCQGKDLN